MFGNARNCAVAVLLLALPMTALASGRQDVDNMDCSKLPELKADAEHGDAKAQLKLALLYLNGKCVADDPHEVGVWLKRSTDQGYAPAQVLAAGLFHRAGDDAGAAQMARLAAEQGEAFGQGILAYSYQTGNGIGQDYIEAAKWARRAAEQGDGLGQLVLAELYVNGKGGFSSDLVEADKWYLLAEMGGGLTHDDDESRKRLELRMKKVERVEAQRRASSWRPTAEQKR